MNPLEPELRESLKEQLRKLAFSNASGTTKRNRLRQLIENDPALLRQAMELLEELLSENARTLAELCHKGPKTN
jgi:hypothetical protein